MAKITRNLNTFLSYLHMGAATFRIYMKESSSDELVDLFTKHIKRFKEFEKNMNDLIQQYQAQPIRKVTCFEKRVLFMEKLRCEHFKSDSRLAERAIRSINTGLVSSLSFVKKRRNLLNEEFMILFRSINDYYIEVIIELKDYLTKKLG